MDSEDEDLARYVATMHVLNRWGDDLPTNKGDCLEPRREPTLKKARNHHHRR